MNAGRAVTALVNPIAGRGRAARAWAPCEQALRAAGVDVRTEATRSREHAILLAGDAAAAGRVVVAVGGDGLVRDAAGGVVAHGGVLAVVPAGRGDDLARRLGLTSSPEALARALRTGIPRPLDVIEVNSGAGVGGGMAGVIVPGNVYAGIDSVANQLINRSRLPGLLAYRLAPVRAILRWSAPSYTLTLDGQARTVTAHTVVVANTGAYGHGLAIVPGAAPDDGLLHVLVVGAGPRRAVVAFLREARSGAHVRRPEVEVLTARRVELRADRPVPLYGDGDEVGTLPATLRLRPGALQLLG